MELTPRDATDLARFAARRWPERNQLDQIARKAGVELEDTLAGDMVAVWSTVIVEARVQGRLRKLARVMARMQRDDERLQEVCDLLLALEDPAPVPPAARLAAALLVIGVAVAGASWVLGQHDDVSTTPAEAPVADAEVAPPAAQAAAPAPDAVPPLVEAAATAPSEPVPVAEPQPEPTEAAEVTPSAPQVRTASIAPAASPGCNGAPGAVVGYFYSGRTPPGAQGQTVTLPAAVNVRADYPDTHNGYDARSTVRCTLASGTRLHLAEAPIQVPGDAWWVPLVAGAVVD